MAELIGISDDYEHVVTHVIFVHGLGGHHQTSWMATDELSTFWPKWIAIDKQVGVWSAGYEASPTKWMGSSMYLPDRGENILARLLLESTLKKGNIVFVTHSMGGLVVKQILRAADRDRLSRPEAESFLHRVKRVAFIGTPHFGSDLASSARLMNWIIRRSNAMEDLERNHAGLRDLNTWYRTFARNNHIENLVLTETQPVKVLGMIVRPDSSDPGVESNPIPIDACHISIIKPASQTSEVYLHVLDFINKPFENQHFDTLIVGALNKNTSVLQNLTNDVADSNETLKGVGDSLEVLLARSVGGVISPAIVDAEANKRLQAIRQRRFYGEYDYINQTKALAESVLRGDLSACSPPITMHILAWCARMLYKDDLALSKELLAQSKKLGSSEAIDIVDAIIKDADGHHADAIEALGKIDSIESRTTAFTLTSSGQGVHAGMQWLSSVGLKLSALGGGARLTALVKYLESESLLELSMVAKLITEEDFSNYPVLYHLVAQASLLPSVPEEFRSTVLGNTPFGSNDFPLSIEADAIEHRNTSRACFLKAAEIARSLTLPRAERYAADMALWLSLNDTVSKDSALAQLKLDMINPQVSLRRLSFALEFDLDIDLVAVEKEIDRQTALSGGKSEDAAVARFALAHTRGNHEAMAEYLCQHKTQLLSVLNSKAIVLVLIEVLARAGRIAEAEALIDDLDKYDSTPIEIKRAMRIVAEAKGSDPVQARLENFLNSGSLPDLNHLVKSLEDRSDWSQLKPYIADLFERTHDSVIGQRYIHALYEVADLNTLLQVLDQNPALCDSSLRMREYRCRALFELGRFESAREIINELRQQADSEDFKALEVSIVIASGDWDHLHVLVDSEWQARGNGTKLSLIRAAKLAAMIRSPRTKDLTIAAAMAGKEDPQTLISCYEIATRAGWKADSDTHSWIESAISLSGETGPARMVSLESLLDEAPQWRQRSENTAEMLRLGNIPQFAASRLLNTPFLNMLLYPFLANPQQSDIRKCSALYSFHGANNSVVHSAPKRVLLDISCLVTLEVIGISKEIFETFEEVSITHDLLLWLFEERQRIVFHQPSRVHDARELRDMISGGELTAFEASDTPSESLIELVGEELADTLETAKRWADDTGKQHIIVHPFPVHRPGSLTLTPVDLGEHESFFCSCMSVIEKLSNCGELTVAERGLCEAFLVSRTQSSERSVAIEDGATLYLDDVVVSYFQHLNILSKLHRAGLTAYVSAGQVRIANDLLEFDRFSKQGEQLIESIRCRARDEIKLGRLKVKLPIRTKKSDTSSSEFNHPTMTLFSEGQDVDWIVVDDRSLNKTELVTGGADSVHLTSTLALLNALVIKNVISVDRLWSIHTMLRRCSAIHVPVSTEELLSYLNASTIEADHIVESAELKAIRRSVLHARMLDTLNFSTEMPWFVQLSTACMSCIQTLWGAKIVESETAVRSSWLFSLIDARLWGNSFERSGISPIDAFKLQLSRLLLQVGGVPESNKEQYLQWIEINLLQELARNNISLYQDVVNDIGNFMLKLCTDTQARSEHAPKN